MTSSRLLIAAVVAASPLLAVAGPAAAGHADTPMPPTVNCPASYSGSTDSVVDFDGDGIADAVVAIPGADGGKGAVEVRYSRGSKTTTFTPGDGVIPAVSSAGPPLTFATLDINYDGCTDLAIGIPSYSTSDAAGAGAVQILYGGKDGFVAGPLITPDNPALPGTAQAGEHLGQALVGGGANLTIGVPGWSPTIGSHVVSHAGEAIVAAINQYQTSGFNSVYALRKADPHPDDRLGTSVAPDVAAAPTAVGHGKVDAGCFVWGDSTTDVATYCGHHTGDELARSMSSYGNQLYVGSPGHEVMVNVKVKHGKDKGKIRTKTITNAGAVEQFTLGFSGGDPSISLEQITNQASKGVPGDPVKGNEFGYSVSDFTGGREDLAVGVPGETLKADRHAGVVLLRRGGDTSTVWQQIDRSEKGVAGSPTTDNRFGQEVAFAGRGYPGGRHDFLLYVGVPTDSVSGHSAAGRVQVFFGKGTKAGLTSTQLITQSGGPVSGHKYGVKVD